MKPDWTVLSIGIIIGVVFTSSISYLANKDKVPIVKTNIGIFLLDNGKVYGVYELRRDKQGDLEVMK